MLCSGPFSPQQAFSSVPLPEPTLRPTHLSIGVHFAFGFALAVLLSAYILFAKSRFQRMLFEIFRTDRPFLAWLKCLDGYPSKILNRPQKPGSVPPQGRYNAGQRIAYCALIFSEYSFARFRRCFVRTASTAGGTEQCLPIGVMVHSGAFGLACLLLAAHIPMAFLSRQSLKAMLSLGKGFLSEQEAMKHAALWVKEDLEIERNAFAKQSDRNQTILREKRLN